MIIRVTNSGRTWQVQLVAVSGEFVYTLLGSKDPRGPHLYVGALILSGGYSTSVLFHAASLQQGTLGLATWRLRIKAEAT